MKKIEITLKEMLIYVLRRWYVVLAVAAVVAVGYSLYSNKAYEQVKAQHQVDVAAYEKALAAYETDIARSKEKGEKLEAEIASIRDYLDNSLRMTVNPYDYAVSTITLDFDSEENNTILNRATNHYLLLAQEAPLETILADVVPQGTNFSYIKEAISYRRQDNDILVISAMGNEQINPEDITKSLLAYLRSKKDLVDATAGSHSFSVMDDGLYRGSDVSLVNVRNVQEARITAVERQLAALKVEKPVAPQAPASKGGLLLGVLAGLVAGVLIALICYLLFLPIQYGSQVQKQLGLQYFGKIEKSGDALHNLDLVAANIGEKATNCNSILILESSTRNSPVEAVQALRKDAGLQHISLLSGADLQSKPETIKALGDVDGVVLALEQYHSRIRKVWADVERVTQSGKPVLGYFVQ